MPLEFSLLPPDGCGYAEFQKGLERLHQIAAPDCDPGFFNAPLRHANGDGTYYHFPHPKDREEILEHSRASAQNITGVSESMAEAVGLLAAHPFKDGNGRTARVLHALRAGKSSAEIESLGICGPRYWLGTDTEAQAVIDLRPPVELLSYIDEHVYEVAGAKKATSLQVEHRVSQEELRTYIALLKDMPPSSQEDLTEVIQWSELVLWPDSEFYISLRDKAGLEFALSMQRHDENTFSDGFDIAAVLANLGEDGLKGVVEDLWRYRLLRARATIDCLGSTALGSRFITLTGHDEPMSVADHYVRLTNNLVKA